MSAIDLQALAASEGTERAITQGLAQLKSLKPAELFLSDIHGEYRAFSHVLKNACGSIRATIEQCFPELSSAEKDALATLIYYPSEKMALELPQAESQAIWLSNACERLAVVLYKLSRQYTAMEVEQLFPENMAAVARALVSDPCALLDKRAEHGQDLSERLVEAICQAIHELSVSQVHLVGDIYDRGPAPDLIMDVLDEYPHVDIQWGNHDIVWMGASLGQRGCVANVVRICARYSNLDILEDTYGIDLTPLTQFALKAYADDPCVAFGLKGDPGFDEAERARNIKIQKAMSFIQFKVEAQHIADNPSFNLESRNLLHLIDHKAKTIIIDGVVHPLLDSVFPTIDPANPYQLTPEEEQVIDYLSEAFRTCERLQRHIQVFLDKGGLYKIQNNMLMFHACVPLNADGSLMDVNLFGETLSGKALFDAVDKHVRAAFQATDPTEKKRGMDLLWYLWLGEGSPLFAKSKMATLELYLVADKAARKEVKNSFYTLYEDPKVVGGIFTDFGMDPAVSHIVCGHVPVKIKDGESPVKCGGKVLAIDGGMSEAYQKTTGIAGLVLVSDAQGLRLASLDPLLSIDDAIKGNLDIHPQFQTIWAPAEPLRVADTDEGTAIAAQVKQLQEQD